MVRSRALMGAIHLTNGTRFALMDGLPARKTPEEVELVLNLGDTP